MFSCTLIFLEEIRYFVKKSKILAKRHAILMAQETCVSLNSGIEVQYDAQRATWCCVLKSTKLHVALDKNPS